MASKKKIEVATMKSGIFLLESRSGGLRWSGGGRRLMNGGVQGQGSRASRSCRFESVGEMGSFGERKRGGQRAA